MFVMDDPRLDGWLWITRNEDAFRASSSSVVDLGSVRAGTVGLVNEQGSWVGSFYAYATGVHPSAEVTPPERVHRHFLLSGTGAYAGLSALLDSDEVRGQPQPHDVHGLVFPGSLPEYPDPVEVPEE